MLNIALLISDYSSSEYGYNICKYVKEQCMKLNVNLFVYEGKRFMSDNLTERQHNVVYNLISKNTINGIISVTPGICYESVLGEYQKLLNDLDIPVVSIGWDISNFPSIIINNEIGMVELVNHLVEYHPEKEKFAYITGPTDNVESKKRLKVFKKELRKFNKNCSPSNIYAGDFTPISGYNVAKKMIKKIINKKIDTIVCSNDEMAFGVIQCLKYNNINIPEDVIITGFDDFNISNGIKISTVRQPLEEMSKKSVEMIIDIIENNACSIERVVSFDTHYVARTTCSCTNDCENSKYINMKYFHGYFERIQTFDLNELYKRLNEILKEVGINNFFIVKYNEDFDFGYNQQGIPQKSHIIFGLCNSKNIIYNEEFDTKDVLPKEILNSLNRKNLFIKPLFFESRHFGYFVSENDDYDVKLIEDLCPVISNAIMGSELLLNQKILMNNLSLEYKKLIETEQKLTKTIQELNIVNNQLHGVAERDEMTNVYSRYGFQKKVSNFKENDDKPFYLIYCDMDGLKSINDNYGHDDGDLAIVEMANVLKNSVRADSQSRTSDFVVRMGGDEFIVIVRDISEENIKIIENRLVEGLEKCNEKLKRMGKLWKLSFSWGYIRGNSFNDLIDIMRKADTLMYENKKKKKQNIKPL